MHLVENIRPDVELVDVEVMTYGWSTRLQKFHTRLTYPADFWHTTNRVHPDGRKSFTFKTLIDANIKRLVEESNVPHPFLVGFPVV